MIEFGDLPVECPIISVKKIVHKGNKVVFQEKGGYILNVATRKKLRFIEKRGVYFIKIRVHPPDDDDDDYDDDDNEDVQKHVKMREVVVRRRVKMFCGGVRRRSAMT